VEVANKKIQEGNRITREGARRNKKGSETVDSYKTTGQYSIDQLRETAE
jgi:hypothetical protein